MPPTRATGCTGGASDTTAEAGGAGADPMPGAGTPATRCGSHSGFSVATTNSTATATVTACEKRSQVLRMKRGGVAARGVDDAATGSVAIDAPADYERR